MSVHLALEMINVFHTETKEVHRVSELRNLIDKLQQVDIDTGTKEKSTYEKIKSRVEQHLNSPKVGLSGVHAGFLNINKATDGWQPTDLIILAARPSMGGFAPLVSNNKLKIA
jgi:replicative DNA helicase